MSKVFKKSYVMTALICMLIACLTCGTLVLTANAQEEEPTSTLTFTSYTSVMRVEEEFTFAALVTNEDGTTSTEVTWSSSNEDVIYIEEGLATALSEGNATITATAGELSASINVLVSDEAVLVTGVTLNSETRIVYMGETYQLEALVLPEDATDKNVTWKSSDESIATVDENGLVTAIAVGEADITVTTNDHMFTATCKITVIDEPYGEATLDAESLTLHVNEIGSLTVSIPEGVTAEAYEWTSSITDIATPGVNSKETAPIYTWSFGTTTINVVVTDTSGMKYQASATVLVNANYFYLVGLDDDWSLQDSAADAEAAGVLLAPVEGQSNVYSITRSVKAYQGFQIVHSGMDADWTTKITPYWYSADGSTDEFVANANDMFQVTAYGSYTITLDLNDGMAKVFINHQSSYVTEVNLKITEGNAVLAEVGDSALISIELLPAGASYNPADISVSVTGALSDGTAVEDIDTYVSYELDAAALTVKVEALALPESTITVSVKVALYADEEDGIETAEETIQLELISADAVLPTSIAFDQDLYELDVNNGGLEWTTTVLAEVDADATVRGITYSTSDTGITVDSVTGLVTASAFGTFTVTATAVGDEDLVVTTQVVVYSSAFYLIGTLDGMIPNNWIALDNETYRTLVDTPFENWGLTSVDGSLTEYSGEFILDENDLFAIVFLGMDPGTWYGAINSANFDAANSTTYVTTDGTNIKILADGKYKVNLTLGADGPSFNVELIELYEFVPYDLHTYLLRAGDAWDGSVSAVENMLVDGGYITVDNEGNKTLTFRYDFSGMTPWAVFQFITATGTAGGFADATWYADNANVTITGDAYGNEDGKFWNDGTGCQFWYVGDSMPTEIPEVEFTVTFDATGHITAIAMNFVTETSAE